MQLRLDLPVAKIDMADFDKSIGTVLAHEGGYVSPEDAARNGDPGGETFCGIARNSWPQWSGWTTVETIKLQGGNFAGQLLGNLNLMQAVKNFYHDEFWNPLWDEIDSQAIATKLLDIGVNMGVAPAVRILQQSLGSLCVGPVVIDGKFGARTLDYVNGADEQRLLQELRARMAKRYAMTAAARPTEEGNLLGWMRRAVE